MGLQQVVAVCLVAVVVSLQVCQVFSHHHDIDYHAHPHYKFDYSVHDPHSHDVKSQWEHRDGDKVHGGYSVHDPDGTVRHVEYTADKHNGFNAVVKKTGHAHHPHVYGDANPHGYPHH
ncbi:cuticle protein 19-like [Macrosteles quadrilineatus]|uniref:cuticle protein 19-like n=1 Tax=Macrosteles quadrilineatus TaxID=74068 RepID=UPI0023E0E98B|nr:cuticle protein 19-like [Macrosteles quadrilineatus]